jgi:hypothetical protein
VFELIVVPGLVQTAEYARHVFITAAEFQDTPPDTNDAVRIRLERQHALYDSAKSIELLMAESALRYFVCPPEVMVAQIDRLIALSGLPSVRLGIIPLDTRLPTVPTNGFWIVGDTVLIETIDSEINTDSPTDLETYHRLADMLWTVAARRRPGTANPGPLLDCHHRGAQPRQKLRRHRLGTKMDKIQWKKSARSVGNPEQYIELGTTPGKRYVRDSKNQHGPALSFPPAPFATFMRKVQTKP